jgi:hypothetical protein
LVEEMVFELVGLDGAEAELGAGEHGDELFAVDELDGRHAVAGGFFACFAGEAASCEDEAFVGAALHGAPEVADLARRYGTIAVALALKEDFEGNERIDLAAEVLKDFDEADDETAE